MSDVVLYHVPPSGYSQVARLLLAEKRVSYRSRYVLPGPPAFGGYAPAYMRLNPQGTVPTLTVDGAAIPGSLSIGRYVDAHMAGATLTPTDPKARERMEYWLEIFEATSMRDISYGSLKGRMKRFATRTNMGRIRNLNKRLAKHPELADAYRAKVADIEAFEKASCDREHLVAIVEELNRNLDALDKDLALGDYIAGDEYSLADGVWTALIARLGALGLGPLEERASLASWYERMQARPSFKEADIWDRMGAGRMAKTVLLVMGPKLALVATVLALGIVGLVWLL